MSNEYTVCVQANGDTYSAHLNTESRIIQIYCNNERIDTGVWVNNQIARTHLAFGPNPYSELSKALLEAMYV